MRFRKNVEGFWYKSCYLSEAKMLRICFGISDANNTYTLFVYDKDKITMKNLIPTPGFADIDFCSFGGSMLSGNAWHLNQDKAWTFQEYYDNSLERNCTMKHKDVCGKGIAWSLAVSLWIEVS